MPTTAISNQLLIDRELTQGLTGENQNSAHVLNIVNYHKNNRIADLSANAKFAIEHDDQPNVFNVPEIKQYHLFNYKNSFGKSQNWIGYVTSVCEQSFYAKIEDLNIAIGTYEEVEFDIDDIEEEDVQLLSVGSVFYWSVGYEYRHGTKSKQSILRFKRLPKLNVVDVDNAADLADRLFNNLNWD